MSREAPASDPRDEPRAAVELARKASVWLLGISVIGSALAIGTVHTTTLLVVAFIAFASVALGLYGNSLPESTAGPSLSLPVITCGGLALYSILQAAPLPMGLLRAVAPANADVWERALLPFGELAPRWASLSLDPGASVVEAVKWATYGAVFASAAAVSARRSASWGMTVVFASAMLAALATLAHGLAGATNVYGIYRPAFAQSVWHVGPLLNPNNLAGYLNLGALAGLGLALTRKPVLPPWLLGVGVALIVGVEITSASRAGVLALPMGVLALALITRRRGGAASPGRNRSTWAMVAFAGVGGAVLAALGASRSTWTELYSKDISKVEMLLWAKPLLRDHPLFGVGRGAFESVFPAYRLIAGGNNVFTHAENFPAQWASEWGVPVTIAALVAFGWAFRPRALGVGRSVVAASAWLGVVVLLLQNMFDLGLEVPAICIAVAAVLGSIWGDRRRGKVTRDRKEAEALPRDRTMRSAFVVAIGGLLLIGLAARFRSTDVASDRVAVHDAYEGERLQFPEDAKRVRGMLRDAMLRHPAEPYFSLVGALVAMRAHDQSPMPWLQHALERGQINGHAHLLLAEYLGSRGARKQAFFELRTSVENDGDLAGPAAMVLLRWTRNYDELITAIPEGRKGILMLGAVAANLNRPEDWPERTRCNQEIIARDPTEVGARVREAEARISALDTGKPEGLCADREACRKNVLEHAAAIEAAKPETSTAPVLRARLLLADKKTEEAVTLLEVECQKVTDRLGCLQTRVSAAAQLMPTPAQSAQTAAGRHPGSSDTPPDRLSAASKELVAAACSSPANCAYIADWVGQIRLGRGEVGLALALFERAANSDPTEARWLKVADIASTAGMHARAADTLERVVQRYGGVDAGLRQRIQNERSLAARGLYER